MNYLYHITWEQQATEATIKGSYEPAAFAREGFIHCSYSHQVQKIANFLFIGQEGLVVLKIDPTLVEAEIIDENLEGGEELFPHIYGRLNWDAVVGMSPLKADENGHFEFEAHPAV
jgi:uncharacterized protein (DUF952 family)